MTVSTSKHVDYVHSVIRTDALSGIVPSENKIWQSWVRCVRDYGLDPASRREVVVVDNAQLLAVQERMAELLATAKIEMTNLYQQLAGSGFAVLLTDPDGIVLHCVGDPDFTASASKNGNLPPAGWVCRLPSTTDSSAR